MAFMLVTNAVSKVLTRPIYIYTVRVVIKSVAISARGLGLVTKLFESNTLPPTALTAVTFLGSRVAQALSCENGSLPLITCLGLISSSIMKF